VEASAFEDNEREENGFFWIWKVSGMMVVSGRWRRVMWIYLVGNLI